MDFLHLKIITPKKIVLEKEVVSLTLPSAQGEITLLPKHTNLFALLIEGIVTLRTEKDEEYLAIGGGYIEINKQGVNLLVSRAYHQDEIDEKVTEKAISDAKNLLVEAKDRLTRKEAGAILRRSLIDQKLLRRRKR